MSKLLGPDGRPLTGGRVIGGPKSLDDLPIMTEEVIDAMALQANGLLAQGTPLEVPVAMPQAILFGMIRTLQQGQADRKMLKQILSTLQEEKMSALDLTLLLGLVRAHLEPELGPDAA